MDKIIDTRTLVEQADAILDEAGTGAARFTVARDGKPDVVISSPAIVDAPSDLHERFGQALDRIWAHVEASGMPPMTMKKIDEDIAAYRREKRDAASKR